MKKTFFNPADLQFRQRLPHIGSRRIFGSSGDGRASASYRDGGSDEDDDDDDDEDEGTPEQRKLMRNIRKSVKTMLKSRASQKQLDDVLEQFKGMKDMPIEALREIADKDKGVTKQMVDMGLEVTKLKEELAKRGPSEDMSVRGQVARWQETNKDAIKSIRAGKRQELPMMEIRVASPMHVSTVNAAGSPYIGRVEVESGINDFLRLPLTFWDNLPKGRTSSPTYVWVNKTNADGAAAFIGPGVPKPGISFELVADQSVAKKVADSAKAGTELLEDIDGMTTFIEQELREQVMIKVNSTLQTGVSSTTVPAGIRTLSTTYTTTDIKTTDPTYVDAIRAVVGQLRSGVLTGPITIFINSIDAANMDIAKASTSGVYLLPPFVTQSGMTIAGAKIVEDNAIPVGYFQAAFLRYYRILIYKDLQVSWGWENDDFTKNLVTAVGEMRLHQFFNQIHTGAFVYDSFANVIAAITAA